MLGLGVLVPPASSTWSGLQEATHGWREYMHECLERTSRRCPSAGLMSLRCLLDQLDRVSVLLTCLLVPSYPLVPSALNNGPAVEWGMP